MCFEIYLLHFAAVLGNIAITWHNPSLSFNVDVPCLALNPMFKDMPTRLGRNNFPPSILCKCLASLHLVHRSLSPLVKGSLFDRVKGESVIYDAC
jgi:hypothetical protein